MCVDDIKKQIKNNFSQALPNYADFAVVQKKSACDLISLLPRFSYENILDVGCGTGFVLEELKKYFFFKTLTGLDFSENIISYCQKKWVDYHFICGDAEKFSPKKNYDLVVSNFSLQWFSDVFLFVKNFINYLNKRGVFLVAFPIQGSFKNLQDAVVRTTNKKIFLHKFHSEEKLIREINALVCLKKEFIFTYKIKNYYEHYKNPWEALFSIKKIGASYAGVGTEKKAGENAEKNHRFSIKEMRGLKMLFQNCASNAEKFFLDYRVFFLLIEKK